MLVRIFLKVDSLSVLLTAILAFFPWLLYIPAYIHSEYPMPLYQLLTGMFSGTGNVVLYIAGAFLNLLAAMYLNYVINTYDASENRSYLPGLFYVMVMSLFPEWMLFHPILFVNILAIHILGKILRIYRDPENLALNFDIGVFTGMATLFYFPASWLMLFFMVATFVLRPFNWRDWASAFTGFLLPFFFVALFYFMTDNMDAFSDAMKGDFYIPNPVGFDISKKINFAVFALLLISAAVTIAGTYYKSITVTRKVQVVVLVFFAACMLIALISGEPHPFRFTIMALPLSLLLAYLAMKIRRRILADVVLLAVFLLIVFNHLYTIL